MWIENLFPLFSSHLPLPKSPVTLIPLATDYLSLNWAANWLFLVPGGGALQGGSWLRREQEIEELVCLCGWNEVLSKATAGCGTFGHHHGVGGKPSPVTLSLGREKGSRPFWVVFSLFGPPVLVMEFIISLINTVQGASINLWAISPKDILLKEYMMSEFGTRMCWRFLSMPPIACVSLSLLPAAHRAGDFPEQHYVSLKYIQFLPIL